jgi:hypothetical protein
MTINRNLTVNQITYIKNSFKITKSQSMKVKRWRHKAVDTEESASVIKEDKALTGPYSHEVCT